jgi:hypothetical protein
VVLISQEAEADQQRQAVAAAHREAVLKQVYTPGQLPLTLLRPGDRGCQSEPGRASRDGWGGNSTGRPPWKSVGGVRSTILREEGGGYDSVRPPGEYIVASHHNGALEDNLTAHMHGTSKSIRGVRTTFLPSGESQGRTTLGDSVPRHQGTLQQAHARERPQSPNPWTVSGRRPRSSSPAASRPQSPNPWTESGHRPRTASPLGTRPSSPDHWAAASTNRSKGVSQCSRPRSPVGGALGVNAAYVWINGDTPGTGSRPASPDLAGATGGGAGRGSTMSSIASGERNGYMLGGSMQSATGNGHLFPERCSSPLLLQSQLRQPQMHSKRRELRNRQEAASQAGVSAGGAASVSTAGTIRVASGLSSSGSLWVSAAGSGVAEEAAAVAAGLVSVEDAVWAAGLPRGLTSSTCCGLPDSESVNQLVQVGTYRPFGDGETVVMSDMATDHASNNH